MFCVPRIFQSAFVTHALIFAVADTNMKTSALNNCCLICADETTITLISVSDKEFDLVEKINKYLPVQLDARCDSNTNKTQARCCRSCVDTICNWDKFYKYCAEVQDRELQTLLSKSDAIEQNVAGTDSWQATITDQTISEKQLTKNFSDVSEEHLTKDNKNNCYFCGLGHVFVEDLNNHLINSHSELIFCCDICNKYLPGQQLISHMSDHAEKPADPSDRDTSTKDEFKCDKCQKVFRSFSGIKYHMNSKHVQLKSYNCDICECHFTSNRVLLNHKRSMHNKERRAYVCNECGKAFKTDSTLYTHVKSHTGSKPFHCSYCNKGFRLRHHLTSHLVQHRDSTEPSWNCSICHKSFLALDNLRKHRKIHDQTLGDFTCHICGVKMKQQRYLRTHMKKVHLKLYKK